MLATNIIDTWEVYRAGAGDAACEGAQGHQRRFALGCPKRKKVNLKRIFVNHGGHGEHGEKKSHMRKRDYIDTRLIPSLRRMVLKFSRYPRLKRSNCR